MLLLKKQISDQVLNSLNKAFPELSYKLKESGSPLEPQVVTASKKEFGDFQINCALSLAKELKESPRNIAMAIIKEINKNKYLINILKPPEIAGPGFINLTLKEHSLIQELKSRLNDEKLGVPSAEMEIGKNKGKSIVVDFSSPNIAKEMHVGHLRSTIIGDSLSRILEFRGHRVIRINHVGDWGTQFGMLISYLKIVYPKALKEANSLAIGDLVTFYREAKAKFDEDETFRDSSREEVVKLQNGNPSTLKAWKLLCEQSRIEFQKIYDRLNIRINERGESFYNPFLEQVIDDLHKSGLLVKDNGAQCVFLEGRSGKNNKLVPVIIQKSDGGFNYSTTDLAAIRYRFQSPPKGDGAYHLIYVTDSGQSNHFAGVFEIAKRANWIPSNGKVQHVPFGLVQGADGKKLKTRSGDTIKLKDLLDEAIYRAEQDLRKRLKEENRKESEDFITKVSQTVGLGAVKYADLSQNRLTNYQFSFDRMLALQGNTAPYLLYALVRIAGIARKGGALTICKNELIFSETQEWDLIKELLKFDEVIKEVEEELLPNRLCNYLFDLSQIFNRFYDQIPVIQTSEPIRSSRISLCRLTADTLKTGMDLLGIPTLERM